MCFDGRLHCTNVSFFPAFDVRYKNYDLRAPNSILAKKGPISPMLGIVNPPSRSIDQLVWSVIILFVLSITTLGQTQHIVLGVPQIQNSFDNNSSGTAEAFPVTAYSSGQVDSLSLFLDGSNTATTVWVGVYASYFGHPNRLLSQAVIPQPVSGQWNSVTIPAVQVTQGGRYWVALLGLNGQIEFRDRTSYCYGGYGGADTSRHGQAGGAETSRQTNLTSLPTTWWTGSQRSRCVVSMFGSGVATSNVSVTVSPTAASLQAGQQAQFTATVSGTNNTAITWTASGGTVTSGGQYTAPSSAGTYTLTATSVADSSKSASAVVTVSQPVSISVSPDTASLQTGGQQQFTAYVSGTSNTAVTWSASRGTVTSGLYTAPSAAGTYTVTAVSAADPTKSASAAVSVSAPQAISVSISPTTAAMPQKWQQQFAATVSGSSNTAVTWAVTQGTGTITQSGLYTAPQAVETDIVVATSQADSTKSASASITVVAPHSVALSWSPSSSLGISSYNVYRGTVNGGPYSLLSNGVSSTSYTDSNVQSGSTYYYVTTAVDSSGAESGYSNEAQVVIPMP